MFDFILLSDQPVDCPGNPSYYPDGAGDYPNGCPDNHEDFLVDPGIYPANTGDYPWPSLWLLCPSQSIFLSSPENSKKLG